MEFITRYSDVDESEVAEATAEKNFNLCLDAVSDIKLDERAEILFVEKELRGEIQGYKFRGLIDVGLKDKSTGQIMILDHKSAEYPLKADGSVKANKEDVFYKHKVQLYLYSELYKINYGVYPDYIAWNHFKTGQLLKYNFKRDECEEALNYLVSIIHQIENTEEYEKTPSYVMEKYLCEFRHNCWE